MGAAAGVLVGSRHTAESLWAALPNLSDLRNKTRLGPPGVDINEFRPAGGRMERVRERTLARRTLSMPAARRGLSSSPRGHYSIRLPREPLVVFVGKLIVSKGVDLLIAAWPLVKAKHPEAELKIAGYGEYEGGLRRLLAALESGDLDDARQVSQLGWALERWGRDAAGDPRRLPGRSAGGLSRRWRGLRPGRSSWSAGWSIGRWRTLFAEAEVAVMPSTFPESFGMVAVEAAACGALPVSAGHSGMLEVSSQLADSLPPEIAELLSFPVEEGAVEAIAERLNRWLALPEERASGGPGRAGGDRWSALELGGSGPWRARRGGGGARGSALGAVASAEGHLGPENLRPQLQ